MVEAQHIYQAIGELLATLVVADGKDFLETDSARYRALVSRKLKEKYLDVYQGQQVYFKVYPQCTDLGLAFKIVSLRAKPWHGHGQFVLQGDWMESGEFKIWRNAEAAGKVNAYNWQPQLLPISWSDAPPPDEAFWQLKAKLVDGAFTVVEAAGPFPHPPRLEKLPEHQQKLPSRRPKQLHPSERIAEPQQQTQAKQLALANTDSIDWESITAVSGKLELTIKINTLPQVQQVNGQCHFKINCDAQVFQVSLKPKMWAKLETASAKFDEWVAALTGKLGAATADGFVLENPNIQVFERQQSKQMEGPKESHKAPQAQVAATEPSQVTSDQKAASEAKIPQTKTQAVETATTDNVQKSVAKLDPFARPSTAKADPKPKKVVKFNVEIR